MRSQGRVTILAAVLIFVFALQSFFASRVKSPTSDEPAHIAAGLSYLHGRVFNLNLQHPPLLKEISAASLMLGGIRYPQTAEAQRALEQPPDSSGREWVVGDAILASQGPDRVMFWARLPMIAVATLLGLVLFLWGRQILGDAAALGAVFLYALDPTVLAHSYLVTTDVGLAAFTLLFLWLLWNYVQRPNRRGLVFCGIAMGAMLGAKYSAVAVLPVAALLLAAALGLRRETVEISAAPARKNKKRARPQVAASRSRLSVDFDGLRSAAAAFGWMCLIAAVVVWALFLFRSPFLYVDGLQRVNADHNPNFFAFLAGSLEHRFLGYFAACYLLKEPLAAIALAFAGLWLVLRRQEISGMARLFLLLPPAVLFVGYSLSADNIGIRYIIPVLPFAWLLGGFALATLFRSASRGARIAAVVACAWLVVAAVGIYPDHLSYFNESACLLQNPREIGIDGGSRCGPYWLNESNVDWGQGLKQLKSWLDQHASGRTVQLACFTCIPPEDYGIRYTMPDLSRPPDPALYAISAHAIGSLPVLGRKNHSTAGYWLERVRPVAIVGHAFYIYDFATADAAPRQ